MNHFFTDEIISNHSLLIISLDTINKIESLYNIDPSTFSFDDNVSDILFDNEEYKTLIHEIYYFVQNDIHYDTDLISPTEHISIFNNTTNVAYSGLNVSKLAKYLYDVVKLKGLYRNIESNNKVTTVYKSLINTSINNIIYTSKNNIQSGIEQLIDLSDIIPFFCIDAYNIQQLTSNDKIFILFIHHVLYVGMNHILNNTESQLLLSQYNIDNRIYMESLNYVLETTSYVYDETYYYFTSYVNEIVQFSIPFILNFKKKNIENGFSIYNISLGIIIHLFLRKKDTLSKIAKFNNILYDQTSFDNSVIFNHKIE